MLFGYIQPLMKTFHLLIMGKGGGGEYRAPQNFDIARLFVINPEQSS